MRENPLSSYATKQNRRKLLKAYCDKEPLAKLFFLPEETELAIRTSASRMLLVGTAQIAAKATRDSQGVAVVTLKRTRPLLRWCRRTRWNWRTPTATVCAACPPPVRCSAPRTRASR